MSRYTKIASKYILSKFHQDTSQGAIYERDWVTIGNVHRLEPGKRPYYGDYGFLFTDSTIPVYKKKYKNGKWVGEYTYEDVKNAEEIVNRITVNTDSENLSDYAYWGSLTELFRGSVEHIIKTFPGRLRSTKKTLSIHHHWPKDDPRDMNDGVEWWTEAPGYILGNPFGLDMHTVTADINPDDILRYIALNWQNYTIEVYDEETSGINQLTSYTIITDVYTQYDCEARYFLLCTIVLFSEKVTLLVDTYLIDGQVVYCYRANDDEETYNFLITYFNGLPLANRASELQSSGTNTEINYRGLTRDDVYVPEEFAICPNQNIVDDYFSKIEGFEWKLLNRRSNPFYMNTFLLPIQLKNGNWRLVRRRYTWPSEGVWIDIESSDFDSFITSMVDLCGIYDNLWCDSIWRCMVHESVKNFDWSYRREYDDNDMQENIEGGNRMKDVMRLYGIIYDKTKRYVDGISMHNNVTYDGYNNCPNAQISDRNKLLGWDSLSTQHMFYWYEIDNDTSNKEKYVSLPVLPVNVNEESPEFVSVTCAGLYGTKYYVKKTLPVSDIHFDWVYGVSKQQNPWISTNVYERLYVEVGFASIEPGYDFSIGNRTLDEYPYQLYDGIECPPFVRVVNNNETRYYKLLDSSSDFVANNQKYANGTWFDALNKGAVTPATSDILFNRMLNLSSNRIFKTKGTQESIEMVFALFGFGRYGLYNPNGDYSMTEYYREFTPKQLTEIFYFYEEITEEEGTAHNAAYVESLPKNATENSIEYIYTTTLSYNTYYKLNKDYTVSEAIKQLYAHRLTERIYDDYYSGVPMGETVSGNTHLVVPLFDRKKIYEGNLYFEAYGGWMNTGTNPWENTETIPYLHILQRISDMLTVNVSNAVNGDIYYVADVSDYYEYTDDVPYYLSNFFKLIDKYNSTKFTSWVNVPIEGPIQNGGNSGINGITIDDYKHAKHLNDIIPSILFNNPHTGLGKYDMGKEYKDYMEFPYKFSFDNYLYDDDFYQLMASQFSFMYDEYFTGNPEDKIKITADLVSYDNSVAVITPNNDTTISSNDKYFKIELLDNGLPINTSNTRYRWHVEYFRNVVLPYVAQVIPSTTMLVLENFDIPETMSNDNVNITATIIGDGVVYGTGVYLKSTMVTLTAVPAEGYHFRGWRLPREAQSQFDVVENTLTIMACDNLNYTAVFAENCGISAACESFNCNINNDSQ